MPSSALTALLADEHQAKFYRILIELSQLVATDSD